jgi:hypothetical protein
MCLAEVLTWQWDSELSGRFQERARETKSVDQRHFRKAWASNRSVLVVSRKSRVVEIDCDQVRRELSDYLEGDLTPELRIRIENHLGKCRRCTAVYDGLKNIVQLLGDEKAIELPKGFSERLYRRLFRVQ